MMNNVLFFNGLYRTYVGIYNEMAYGQIGNQLVFFMCGVGQRSIQGGGSSVWDMNDSAFFCKD